jgi:hypothetical protein
MPKLHNNDILWQSKFSVFEEIPKDGEPKTIPKEQP